MNEPKTLCPPCWAKQLADVAPDDTGLIFGYCERCAVQVKLTVSAGRVLNVSTFWPVSPELATATADAYERAALEAAPTGRAN